MIFDDAGYALLVAFVQGVTEFLPISSSGHLILLEHLSGAEQHGLIIDIAAHFGTLCAALIYFRKDMAAFFYGAASFIVPVAPQMAPPTARDLVLFVILASIPTMILGFVLFMTGWVDMLRNIKVIASANLIFAALLFWADRRAEVKTDLTQMNWREALGVGFAQMFALIPGASRAGCCISMMRAFGFSRLRSARFAIFLAIPSIFGALALGLSGVEDLAQLREAALVAFLSFGVSFLVLSGFIRMTRNFSLMPFIIYRVIFAFVLFML